MSFTQCKLPYYSQKLVLYIFVKCVIFTKLQPIDWKPATLLGKEWLNTSQKISQNFKEELSIGKTSVVKNTVETAFLGISETGSRNQQNVDDARQTVDN